MGKNKLTKMQQEEDFLVESLKEWQCFVIREKNKLKKSQVEEEEGIEIMWVNHFKFKKDDVIVIDEIRKKNLVFHVQRKWKDKKEEKQIITFEFNKLIFVQRFRDVSDLSETVNLIKDKAQNILQAAE